jgi:hypothetical protein
MNEGPAWIVLLLLLGFPDKAEGWGKPGATAADFAGDQRACRLEAEQAAAAADLLQRCVRLGERTSHCLQARGWTLPKVGR